MADGHCEAGRVGSNNNQKCIQASGFCSHGLNSAPGPLSLPFRSGLAFESDQ